VSARVLVVGAGGLGCPALLALGAAASGGRALRVTIVDCDDVDVSNLQRQILYHSDDVGRVKVDAATDALDRRFPALDVVTAHARVDGANVRALVAAHDVVLDCTDGADVKFLLNDACAAARVPLVHGGVVGLAGQLLAIPPGGPCLRCLFEAPPDVAPACADAGVLGALCGVIGARMAAAALALLDGRAEAGALHVHDVRTGERVVRFRARPGCCAPARAAAATTRPRA
jgi:molybdopterin-synthase adenylyltransferase